MAQNRNSAPNVTYDKVIDTFHTYLCYHLILFFPLLISSQRAIPDGVNLIEVLLPGVRLLVVITHDTDAIESGTGLLIFPESGQQMLWRMWNQEVGNPKHIGIHVMEAVVVEKAEHLVHHLLCRSSTADKWKVGCGRLATDASSGMRLTVSIGRSSISFG